LNAALDQARGDVLFFTDVRQPLHPAALRHLIANFADPSVGAVTGRLELLPGEDGEQRNMDTYWRYELWARARHSAIDSLFNTTGCIYALRRHLAVRLPADTLSDDAVLPLRAFSLGYRVIYDAEAIAYDHPAAPGTEFRRRLRNLAGLWQVHVRMPWLFSSANRMRRHFLPHKFGRLVLPWVLLIFLAASFALPSGPFKAGLLTAEAVFAVLAIASRWIAPGSAFGRLCSAARAFLVMNASALASVAVFFVTAQRLWRPTRVQR
jgi:cellulose synthase/poly-beta-1,6-N-acetylglucosamine synthase-like glycosyltransferase